MQMRRRYAILLLVIDMVLLTVIFSVVCYNHSRYATVKYSNSNSKRSMGLRDAFKNKLSLGRNEHEQTDEEFEVYLQQRGFSEERKQAMRMERARITQRPPMPPPRPHDRARQPPPVPPAHTRPRPPQNQDQHSRIEQELRQVDDRLQREEARGNHGLPQRQRQQLAVNDDDEPDVLIPAPGFKSVIYFCNWSIYDRKHFPKDIPADRITHVMYAFANINADTGEILLTDPWADTDCRIDSRPPSPNGLKSGTPAKTTGGCFGEFFRLKKRHRHLKLLLSIGGWSFSSNFTAGVNTPSKRETFARTAVDLVNFLALDGVDLDWEYPVGDEQAQQYVDLCRRIRRELDKLAVELAVPRNHFDLAIAAPGGQEQINDLRIAEMDKYLSFWNLMTYDFAGPWSPVTSFHSNLFQGPLSGHATVDAYIREGASPGKLVLGVPVYGRAFAATKGIGQPFNGTGPGTWEDGVIDYKQLPLPGSVEYVDQSACSAWCYDKNSKRAVVYDNPDTIKAKALYIKQRKLAGAMFWESSADLPSDHPRSIIGTMTDTLEYLDMRENRAMQQFIVRNALLPPVDK